MGCGMIGLVSLIEYRDVISPLHESAERRFVRDVEIHGCRGRGFGEALVFFAVTIDGAHAHGLPLLLSIGVKLLFNFFAGELGLDAHGVRYDRVWWGRQVFLPDGGYRILWCSFAGYLYISCGK